MKLNVEDNKVNTNYLIILMENAFFYYKNKNIDNFL